MKSSFAGLGMIPSRFQTTSTEFQSPLTVIRVPFGCAQGYFLNGMALRLTLPFSGGSIVSGIDAIIFTDEKVRSCFD